MSEKLTVISEELNCVEELQETRIEAAIAPNNVLLRRVRCLAKIRRRRRWQRQRQVQLRCGAHLRLLRSAAAVPPSTSALHRHCGVAEVQRAVGEHPQPTDETASCVGHGVVLGCSGRSPLFAPDIQILDLRQRSLCFSSRLWAQLAIKWNEWELMAGLLSIDRAENNNLMLESLKRTSCRRSSRKPPTAASKRRSFEETPVTDVLRRDVHRFGSLPSKALVLQH